MTRKITLLVVLCALPVARSAGGDAPFRFSADRPVDCLHIKLELKVDVPGKSVNGRATIEVQALREVRTVTLDAVELNIGGVAVARDGGAAAPADFTYSGEQLAVEFAEPLAMGQKASIAIDYGVHDPRDGLHFFGPSEDEPDVPLVVWSQGQSISNRYWFPCFDHPNERQTTEMIITTSKGLEASSNGRLVSRKEDEAAGTVTFHWMQDKPHVSYLVSMIVGEFVIEREDWRGKEITYWAHPKYKDDLRRSFANTKGMLDFFSAKIGIEYPWDRYAQICCEGYGGGMENTSATTLGTRALHDERSRLDSDSDGLIAHELAHQWWGDLLTCREWAHIWLNEGFASYFEALWDEHDLGDDEFRYNMFGKADGARRGGKERPVVDRAYDSPDSMFDSRAYPKGAWVLHMLRRRLGDEQFWEMLNKYGTKHAYGTVETVDLRKMAEEVSGRSFERFFYDWTERPGHPEVTVKYQWMNDEKLAKVTVTQTQEAEAFCFPLEMEFRFEGGAEPMSVTPEIAEKAETFYYALAAKPVLLRVDPQQAVLMDLKEQKGNDLWKRQLTEDPDPIGRIRAARHFGESESDDDRKLLADALANEKFRGVQQEIAESLAKSGGDIARDALIAGLSLPNHKVRRTCVSSLASFRDDPAVLAAIRPIVSEGDASYYVEAEAIETYSKLEPDDCFDLLSAALSRDSRNEVIRNAVLRGLGRLRDERVVSILSEWAQPGKPRLCRPTALNALGDATKRMPLDDSTVQSIVDTLTAALEDTGARLRGQAVQSLADIQEPGKAFTALPALRALAANDPSGRVRRSAERAIETIESGKPPQVQLTELREELKEALEQNETMADRIERLEKRLSNDEGKGAESVPVAATGKETAGGPK